MLAVIGLILSVFAFFAVFVKHEAEDEMSIAHRRQAASHALAAGWIGTLFLLLMIGILPSKDMVTVPALKSAIEIVLSVSMLIYVVLFTRLVIAFRKELVDDMVSKVRELNIRLSKAAWTTILSLQTF